MRILLTCNPGFTRYNLAPKPPLEVHIGSLPTGAWAIMPVTVLRGIVGGPTIWLSGGIHGDEVMGVEIVRQLIRHIDPKKLRGTIIAVPIVNIFGFTSGSRYLPDGRVPEPVLSRLGARVAGRPPGAYLLSLYRVDVPLRHGLSLRLRGTLQSAAIASESGRSEDPRTGRCLRDAGRDAFRVRDGSLRGAAQRDGIGVLLYEGGEASRFDLPAVRAGYRGALRVMKALKMLKTAPPRPKGEQMLSRKSSWTRAGRSGFCHLRVKLGEQVEQGQSVATISDSTSTAELNVRARMTGIVVGVLLDAIVHRGDALVHIAEIE